MQFLFIYLQSLVLPSVHVDISNNSYVSKKSILRKTTVLCNYTGPQGNAKLSIDFMCTCCVSPVATDLEDGRISQLVK